MTYHYHGIDAEESILTKSLPNLETWALPNLFFIFNVCFLVSQFYCITMEIVSHHIFDIVTFTSFPHNRVRASKVVSSKLGWIGR